MWNHMIIGISHGHSASHNNFIFLNLLHSQKENYKRFKEEILRRS